MPPVYNYVNQAQTIYRRMGWPDIRIETPDNIALQYFDVRRKILQCYNWHRDPRWPSCCIISGCTKCNNPAMHDLTYRLSQIWKVKVNVHTLDIAPLRSESPPQKRSGMARVLKGFHRFTCTLTRSSAIGMSHTCLCLPSYRWYSFTDPGGWVDLGAK